MKAIKTIRVLSEEKTSEIYDWLESTRQEHWKPTSVVKDDPMGTVDHAIRKGYILKPEVIPDAMNKEIQSNLIVAFDTYKQKMYDSYSALARTRVFDCVFTLEGIQFLRYDPGDHYEWHSDRIYPGISFENGSVVQRERRTSIVLYLTNDFEGGQTEFSSGMIIKPKPGEALFFPSYDIYPHRARALTSGRKYALVTWAVVESLTMIKKDD